MKILFITHETSRTGAPMVLLHFLKWLQGHKPEVVVDVLALNEGGLMPDFKKNCNMFYSYKALTKYTRLTRWQRILLKIGLFKQPDLKAALIKQLGANNYDVIYANTVVSVPIAVVFKRQSPNIKLVVHIHELHLAINRLLPDLKVYVSEIDTVIAASNLVKDNLVKNWNVLATKISVVYEFSRVKPTAHSIVSNQKAFIVGGAGTVELRKGSDLFVQVARYIKTHYPECNIKFNWVGAVTGKLYQIIEGDIGICGLEKHVVFLGEQEQPQDYFCDFDVFLLPSREDPFPLVCIEVGMLGKPIISFENATGTNEVIAGGGGFIVPYLNIEAMVDKIIMYYNNSVLKDQHGAFNKQSFAEFTPEKICPILFNSIKHP